MAENLGVREKLIAVDVITVMMRIDQTAEILAGGLLGRGNEPAGRNRSLRSVYSHQEIGSGDHACVVNAGGTDARAAALRVRIDIWRELPQFTAPARRHGVARIRCWR